MHMILRKNRKLILFAALILAIFICNRIFGWSDYLKGGESFNLLKQMAEEHRMAAILLYVVFTVVGCVALTLPGVTFAVLAGLLFGPVLGTVCCSLATLAGAMAAFLAGRFFLKDSIKPVVMKNRYLKKWLFDETGKNEVFILMITRLVPLFPYNLQNFAYGVTDISFRTYSLYSFLFMLPGTAMYTVGVSGLADRENRILYFAIALFLAVTVMGIGLFLQKKYVAKPTKETDETEEAHGSGC